MTRDVLHILYSERHEYDKHKIILPLKEMYCELKIQRKTPKIYKKKLLERKTAIHSLGIVRNSEIKKVHFTFV